MFDTFEFVLLMWYEMGNFKKKTLPKTSCFSTKISEKSEKI